jgi:Glycosyltransferase family 87
MTSSEMDSSKMSPAGGESARLARPVELTCFALIIANVVLLGSSYIPELMGQDGAGGVYDFVTIWSAGRLAVVGQAAAAYDWPTLKLVDESVLGHPFEGYLGWLYPPTFLFVAASLSLFPYAIAFAIWVFGTFLAYLAAIRAIVGDRKGYFLAAAFPAVVANIIVGQNGFLSAALIGGTLTFMERRPICAGVLLGLLTYKPQLGILFPIVLLASGRWRVLITATIVAALIAAASWAAFGIKSWQAFLPGVAYAVTSNGMIDWGKLQTAFGLTRALGGSEVLAWTVQIVVAFIAAGAITVLWRSRATSAIKAAALGVGTLLATPHLFAYDLVVLAVPLAFMFQLGCARGFLPYELTGMGLACLLILIFPFVKAPVGFAAIFVVAALIIRRALVAQTVAISTVDGEVSAATDGHILRRVAVRLPQT